MKKVYAIVTLYNPNQNVVRNIKALSKQVDKVFLSDNSEDDNSSLFLNIPDTCYSANRRNYGLPVAINKVLKNYHFDDWDYILFFDQDSSIEIGHVKKLIEEYDNTARKFKVGCLGPVFFNSSNKRIEIPRMKRKISNDTYIVRKIITSSMITQYGKMKDIGFWNEELFLDFADWDVCWRFSKKGYATCITEKTVLKHSLGNGEKRVGPIKLRVGQPIREYYQTRDALYLLRESYVPFSMKTRLLMNVTIRPIIHYFAFDDKELRMSYIKKGFSDFRNGIHGELKK